MTYRITITPTAFKMLKSIKDTRIRTKLIERIDALQDNPGDQGKALLGELTGLRSVRAVGQRFRILYQINKTEVVVCVVALGIRRDGDRHDIYALAQKLVRTRLAG